MSRGIIDFTDQLVSVSDFSQGKASRIFTDVFKNNQEYIVLKNNQPMAVVLSVKEYKGLQKKIKELEARLNVVD